MLKQSQSNPSIVMDEAESSDVHAGKTEFMNQTECVPEKPPFDMESVIELNEEEVAEKRRMERMRKSRLYGVTDHYPSVAYSNHHVDVRCRLDLEALASQRQKLKQQLRLKSDSKAKGKCKRLPGVQELENQKQKEDYTGRPILSRIAPLHDLMTTVPRDLESVASFGKQSCSKAQNLNQESRPWRVGYRNAPTDYHLSALGIDGVLEPSTGACEVLLLSNAKPIQKSPATQTPIALESNSDSCGQVDPPFRTTCVAYPPVISQDAAASLKPTDFVEASKMANDCLRVNNTRSVNVSASNKLPWRPASSKPTRRFSAIPSTTQTKTQTRSNQTKVHHQRQMEDNQLIEPDDALEICQRFPLRRNELKCPSELHADARCIHHKTKLLTRLCLSFQKLQRAVDKHKKSSTRYSLPIENPTSSRSYRLGLEIPPRLIGDNDTSSPTIESTIAALAGGTCRSPSHALPTSKLRFRPRSAVTHRTSLAMRKIDDTRFTDLSKVAGAKRRPQSAASMSFLRSATVYCLDSDACALENENKRRLAEEKRQRRQHREEIFARLTNNGGFVRIPLDQLFTRLKSAALCNLQVDLQQTYENISMDEYSAIVEEYQSQQQEMERTIRLQKPPEDDPESDQAEEGSLEGQAKLRADLRQLLPQAQVASRFFSLALTREQFVGALKDLTITYSDLNGFYTILDDQITNKVHIYDVLQQVKRMHKLLEQQRSRRMSAPQFSTKLFKR